MIQDQYQQIEQRIAEIEAEMKRIGYWQESPLPAEAYNFQLAFAMDTMAYSQWLQFVFIPRVHSIVESRGVFPPSSSVGTQGLREFDGDGNALQLVSLLCRFDEQINTVAANETA
jgi:uncharacterized protein YqcC (DUF446 family)